MGLYSSVGIAMQRQRRGHAFKSWPPSKTNLQARLNLSSNEFNGVVLVTKTNGKMFVSKRARMHLFICG